MQALFDDALALLPRLLAALIILLIGFAFVLAPLIAWFFIRRSTTMPRFVEATVNGVSAGWLVLSGAVVCSLAAGALQVDAVTRSIDGVVSYLDVFAAGAAIMTFFATIVRGEDPVEEDHERMIMPPSIE